MLPSTLEWHVAAVLAGVAGLFWWPAWGVLALLLGLSLIVSALQASQAQLLAPHKGVMARLVVMGLCYAQPLVRSWARYRTRLLSYDHPRSVPVPEDSAAARLPFSGNRALEYWSEQGHERTELLGLLLAHLLEYRWGTAIDSGWSEWDVEVHYHPWTLLQICTAQEEHGGNKRLIRVRYRMRPTEFGRIVGLLALAVVVVLTGFHPLLGAAGLGVVSACLLGSWWCGVRAASRATQAFDGLARGLGLIRCGPGAGGGR
jgi:hypothetical protein